MDQKRDRRQKATSSRTRNQEAISMDREITVEKILKKRTITTLEYLVKWVGYSDEHNTWKAAGDLRCPELIEEFEKKLRKEQKRKNAESAARAKKRSAEFRDEKKVKITGFDRGLTPDKIIGATDSSGELMFLMKWKDTNEADLVPASQANLKCPEVVISFYNEHLSWRLVNPLDDKSAPA